MAETNYTHPETRSGSRQTLVHQLPSSFFADNADHRRKFEKLLKAVLRRGQSSTVIAGFMLQGGDPTGTGRGGPGYSIKDELPRHNHNDRGTISMANAGPNTGGSQFFINLVNNNFLDDKHPAFGKVIEGMEVVDKIGKVRTDRNDRPQQEVKILKATVVE